MVGVEQSLEEFGSVLTPRGLSQFLGVQSWAMKSRRSFMETWMHVPSGRPEYIHIPTQPTDIDFNERLAEATKEIAAIYGWSVSELAEQVAAIRADLFFVRVAQVGQDGTIPLYRASEIIDSIEKMVKAAAVVTANPRATGRGRTSERVRHFLEDDLRMGHTKRGSFIITVAARLQDQGALVLPRVEQQPGDQGHVEVFVEAPPPNISVSSGEGSGDSSEPELDFTRRVMTNLNQGLDATRRHLANDRDFVGFEDARAGGMSSPLVEAIEELGESASGGSFDMSFRWTPALPQREPVAETVEFSRPMVERAPAVIERFRRAQQPDVETVVGPVVSLSRERLANDEETGEVVVLADVDGVTKRIGMTLSGNDYAWAIYAHQNRYPFTATGLLGKKGRRWWLLDEVEPDTSFLMQRRREYIERQGGDAPDLVEPPTD